jgi:hypothetical protein
MLTEFQQKLVWEEWLASEIRANYFADLAHRYQQRQRITTWAILALSSGAFVALLSDWLPVSLAWLKPTLSALTAAASLWLLVAQNDRSATECADLHFRWNKLATDYRSLWNNMYFEGASARLNSLLEQSAELSKSAVRIPNDTALMEKWQDYVVRHHASDIAA